MTIDALPGIFCEIADHMRQKAGPGKHAANDAAGHIAALTTRALVLMAQNGKSGKLARALSQIAVEEGLDDDAAALYLDYLARLRAKEAP